MLLSLLLLVLLQVIEMLGRIPVAELTDKAQADAVLTGLGLEDAGLRSFVLMNLVRRQEEDQGPKFAWQINVSGIQR